MSEYDDLLIREFHDAGIYLPEELTINRIALSGPGAKALRQAQQATILQLSAMQNMNAQRFNQLFFGQQQQQPQHGFLFGNAFGGLFG